MPLEHVDDEDDGSTEAHAVHWPVVGIGGSMGGIEAGMALLGALPAEPGFSIVLVLHQTANAPDTLADLLGESCAMRVKLVEDGAPLELNVVHVAPAGSAVEVRGGRFHLTARAKPTSHGFVIDRLFESLAEAFGSAAICVILSGSLSDGVLGLRRIRAGGGLTFAQDPSTAVMATMPQGAIDAGAVDYILAPVALAKALVDVPVRLRYRGASGGADRPFSEMEEGEVSVLLDKIVDSVHERTGRDFREYKRATLARRVQRRVVTTHCKDLKDYATLIASDEEEAKALVNEMLIRVTRFFRDPEVFDNLKEVAFPALLKDRDDDAPLRIWVPGCATGEEAYSLAIAAQEYLRENELQCRMQIFGTDLSQPAIDEARLAIYPAGIAAQVPPEILERYFRQVDGEYHISPSIRRACIFSQQDLVSDPPLSHMDLVSCRNVLIYLQASLQAAVASTLHYALKEGGFLLVGNAERMDRFENLFEATDPEHRIYRKRATKVSTAPPLAWPQRLGLSRGAGGPKELRAQELPLEVEADRVAATSFAPPGFVVDEDLVVRQFRGDVTRFLKPAVGDATLDLLRLVPTSLAVATRGALDECKERRAPTSRRLVRVETNDGQEYVNVHVHPLPGRTEGRCFLVTLVQPPGSSDEGSGDDEGSEEAPSHTDELEALRAELLSTQEFLGSIMREYEATYEELRTAHEEALSTNEELHSSNEELETAREELQATNDELSRRNEEVEEVNNDLVNLLRSVDIPILMLTRQREIRRATPTAAKLLNLLSTDEGRPLADLRHPFADDGVDGLVEDVLDSLQVREIVTKSRDGEEYRIRAQPYRTIDDRIDGVVLMFLREL